jgi:hypothetical protein
MVSLPFCIDTVHGGRTYTRLNVETLSFSYQLYLWLYGGRRRRHWISPGQQASMQQ